MVLSTVGVLSKLCLPKPYFSLTRLHTSSSLNPTMYATDQSSSITGSSWTGKLKRVQISEDQENGLSIIKHIVLSVHSFVGTLIRKRKFNGLNVKI